MLKSFVSQYVAFNFLSSIQLLEFEPVLRFERVEIIIKVEASKTLHPFQLAPFEVADHCLVELFSDYSLNTRSHFWHLYAYFKLIGLTSRME